MKVVLGGDGADELLAGYQTFKAERAAGLFRRLPRPGAGFAEAAARRLPVSDGYFTFDFKVKQFLRGAAEPLPLAHQRGFARSPGPRSPGLLDDGDPVDVEAEHLALPRHAGPRPTR